VEERGLVYAMVALVGCLQDPVEHEQDYLPFDIGRREGFMREITMLGRGFI